MLSVGMLDVSNWHITAFRQYLLVWLGWWYRLFSAIVKKAGWRGQWLHLLSQPRDRHRKNPHPHRPASMRDLAAMTADLTASSRRCVHPSTLYLNHGRYIMQTPTQALNIGADVAKDEIVVACSEGSLPTGKLANQRTALLAFLKSLPPPD